MARAATINMGTHFRSHVANILTFSGILGVGVEKAPLSWLTCCKLN